MAEATLTREVGSSLSTSPPRVKPSRSSILTGPGSAFLTARTSLDSDRHENGDGFPFHSHTQNGASKLNVQSGQDDGGQESEDAGVLPPHKSTNGDAKIVSFAPQQSGEGKAVDNDEGALPRPVGNMKNRKSSRLASRMRALGLPGSPSSPSSGFPAQKNTTAATQSSPVAFWRLQPSENTESAIDESDIREETEEDVIGNTSSATLSGRPSRWRTELDREARTEPSTPQRFAFSSRSQSAERRISHDQPRIRKLIRRSTTDDAGVSEDEGKSRAKIGADWRRRSAAWVQGVQGSRQSDNRDAEQSLPAHARPGHLRRITGIARITGKDASSTDPATSSPWRSGPAAQKWRQLKAGLKLLGQKRKEANRLDQSKSAELVAELLAGGPAAVILASHFLHDEPGNKRIPVLLEQLKLSITDSQVQGDAGPNRNILFRIELEYGSGIMKMKWVIHRTLRDFWNLHASFKRGAALSKLHRRSEYASKSKIPRFPRSAFPFAGEFHDLNDEEEEEEEDANEDEANAAATSNDRPARHRRNPSSVQYFRRRSSVHDVSATSGVPATTNSGDDAANQAASSARRAERLEKRQQRKLEIYLSSMLKYVMFRPGSNRMCRFLELSSLGIKLAVEGGFHGKEGLLSIQSGKGVDFRRAWQPSLFVQRHRPMWFLVRHSYIVCVESPASMNIYDVILVDGDFLVSPKRPRIRDQKNAKDIARTAGHAARHPQNHILRVSNSERRLRLLAKNERQMHQFEDSMMLMAKSTEWSRRHRFDSFAPVRTKVFAQWLVDGRDYMWNVSRALNMARDVIYIHDWWLSPELYMRRPAAISHKWRLDRILKRKAEEGVKIFIIVYRNINSAIPIDSEYTKFALLDLHPNIFVQRSPNQYRQLEFFWAHHEKICVVDHSVAFCGGVDLCFGRWDSPEHRVVDDRPTGWEKTDGELNADTCQMWPGKDYSNPRVQDFHDLSQPFGELYDRTKVPRMPWHDIGMQVVGQPARDLTRHFVQRWNFLLRQRKPTRPTPFLLPPPDFSPGDLEALGLEGTCTVQMLRSACDWSLGTPNRVEHSIMNAYCKLIQTSEHFVYIENQFFISSTVVEGTRIANAIGDALTERILRAHEQGEAWKAVVVIPLMPGFESTVDDQNGTSVRLIMQCQYRSICRGERSIFGRLRAAGIDPTSYIQFYSLRAWGKIGPTKALVTEQLYIHAKIMVVDDRHAIIGSANINERSMRGDRDSEVAACVFDNDMIESVMAGQPYKVGRFPHTLRVRLMREHLGVDVDRVMEEDEDEDEEDAAEDATSMRSSVPATATTTTTTTRPRTLSSGQESRHLPRDLTLVDTDTHTYNHDANVVQRDSPFLHQGRARTKDKRVTGTLAHKNDVDGLGVDHMQDFMDGAAGRGRDTVLSHNGREVLVNDASAGGRGTVAHPIASGSVRLPQHPQRRHRGQSTATETLRNVENINPPPPPPPPPPGPVRMQTVEMGLTLRSQLPPLPVSDDTDIGGPPLQQTLSVGSNEEASSVKNAVLGGMTRPVVGKDCMRDPLNDSFIRGTWHAVALNNTRLFRAVFRCMPDNEVTNWAQYHAAVAFSQRFSHSQGLDQSTMLMQQKAGGKTGPPGHGLQRPAAAAVAVAAAGVTGPAKERPKLAQKLSKLTMRRGRGGDDRAEKEGIQPRPNSNSSGTLNEKEELRVMRPSTASPPPSSHRQGERPATDGSQHHVGFAATLPTREGNDEGQQRQIDEKAAESQHGAGETNEQKPPGTAGGRRRRGTIRGGGAARAEDVLGKGEAEEMMRLVQGHLVEFPYEWLQQEEKGSKWLYPLDQVAPIEI